MSIHFHIHLDHGHDNLVSRIVRDLEAAHDWLTGPAMSEQERFTRDLAQSRNDNYLIGAL